MVTQKPQTEGQALRGTRDALAVPYVLENGLVHLSSEIDPSEGAVIPPINEEEKREAERQACFMNEANKRLKIPTGYLKVAVLVVRWNGEVDAFRDGHDEEILRLKALLCDRFHYEYEEVQLNTFKKPQNALNSAITNHINKHDGPHNLLIVYYTGHGQLRGKEGKEQRLELTAVSDYHPQEGRYAPTAIWEEAERHLLTSADADVLAILDCCFASNAQKGYVENNRIYELLAASPRDEPTVGPGPKSFTTALIESLESLLEEYGNRNFTTIKLLDKLNKIRKTPSMLWDRLHRFQRHVQLAPLNVIPSEIEESFQSLPLEKAMVKLRFSLQESSLTNEQIEGLARELTTACERANVRVRRIDWIKMESMDSSASKSPTSPSLTGLFTSALLIQRRRRKGQLSVMSPVLKRQRVEDNSPMPGERDSPEEHPVEECSPGEQSSEEHTSEGHLSYTSDMKDLASLQSASSPSRCSETSEHLSN